MKKHQEELLQAEFICPTCGRHLAWALLFSSINCPDCGTWVNNKNRVKPQGEVFLTADDEQVVLFE